MLLKMNKIRWNTTSSEFRKETLPLKKRRKQMLAMIQEYQNTFIEMRIEYVCKNNNSWKEFHRIRFTE